jgi:anti-anti-sigma factor
MSAVFRVHVETLDPRHLYVEGELDIHSRSKLDEALAEAGPFQDVTLDLSGVTFIDSTGLNLLLVADQAHRNGGSRLVLFEPSTEVARLIDLTALRPRLIVETADHRASGRDPGPASS